MSRSAASGRPATRVELDLPMPAERIYAHPDVRADVGRVALRRGPLVYCLEQADNADLRSAGSRLPRDAALEPAERGRPLRRHRRDGRRRARRPRPRTGTATSTAPTAAEGRPAKLTAIPYYLWCQSRSGPDGGLDSRGLAGVRRAGRKEETECCDVELEGPEQALRRGRGDPEPRPQPSRRASSARCSARPAAASPRSSG